MTRRLPYYRVLDTQPPRRMRRRSRSWLSIAFISLLLVVMGSIAWQTAHGDEADETAMGLADAKAGSLLIATGAPGRYIAATRLDSEAHIDISGMTAHVRVKQHFRNDSQGWVEGIYVFPLTDNAAVHRMRMIIGERIIEGKIQERAQAKRTYEKAKSEGRKASLVEQERPNMFTNSVANIGPGETITVEIEYLQTVRFDSGVFSLRFPMTITPRYIPGNSTRSGSEESVTLQANGHGWAMDTDQVPDASRITPFLNPVAATTANPINPITLTATLDMGMPLNDISSAYHDVVLKREGKRYQLKLTQGSVSMEQDFVLSWEPAAGNTPQAAVFSEQRAGEDYALLMIVPPKPASTRAALPREMIYIVDTSGSMQGVSIDQAKQSLLLALKGLGPQDRFNIIEFNSTPTPLFTRSQEANSQNIARARHFTEKLQATGGTEMRAALELAFSHPAEESHLRQVVFITDGAVGNEEALFKLIYDKLGSGRLFTVGIGSAPNSHFMHKAAQFGRGTFTHIGNINEVQARMGELLAKLGSPVVANLQVDWPQGATVEMYPSRLPDLYLGEPVVISARAPSLQGMVTISGNAGDQPWQQSLQLRGLNNHSGIATVWAREKIAALLDQKTTGRPEQDVRDDVLKVALLHQLVSPYTSFIAVEEVVSRPQNADLATSPVANARPKGQAPQPFAYPKTATGSGRAMGFGLMFLWLGWLFTRVIRKEEEHGLA
ncbi:MAG: marine proteobacterial sortase target protein [Gammaproteobacteria bacterium]|nr:MAG: marine proteobacterial sortase target protein [Gammaproteobacteria bacterium]